jgi:hypothetical protein
MPGRLVEPAGLKLIHQLLAHPDSIGMPYRELARLSGIALGSVAVVMAELGRAGFLNETGKRKRALTFRARLLEHFVRGYALKLRPACLLGSFRHRVRDPQDVLKRFRRLLGAQALPVLPTGALAARDLTRHLSPENLSVFIPPAGLPFLLGEPMLPDPDHGNVVLLDRFSPGVKDVVRDHATPLLVYAELLAAGGERERETAGLIFREHLLPTTDGP